MSTININGVDFTPIPKQVYAHPYWRYVDEIERGLYPAATCFRKLILSDLFFIVYFVMGLPEHKGLWNDPFIIDNCREVESDNLLEQPTLDVWFRGSGKTTIISVAETLQHHLRNPEQTTFILCYAKSRAEKILSAVRSVYEMPFVRECFRDILWDNGYTESPSWSLQNGITVRRKSSSPDPTILACGLVEGMPTGGHADRLMFDDIETHDMARSPEQLTDAYEKWEMAQNLGRVGKPTIKRNVATFYSHLGPTKRIMDKLDIEGKPMFRTRIKPRTLDGMTPVFGTVKELNEHKMSEHYRSQQLCDPTPTTEQKLNPAYLKEVAPNLIPSRLFKMIVVDPAGNKDTVRNIRTSDNWAIGLIGVKAPSAASSVQPINDDFGINDVYILDAVVDKLTENEAIEAVVRMYLTGGMVMVLAIEKRYGELIAYHILKALAEKQKRLSEDNHSFQWLRDSGRSKVDRIAKALTWPLNSGKLFISTAVPAAYRDRIKLEMEKYPMYHCDALDMLAYSYDIIRTDWATQSIKSLTAPPSEEQLNWRARTKRAIHGGSWRSA